mmetsp:Transcript_6114/g.13525  ORF Transcript_6114/g.13525 Transcript_6114/m.13525 type:complete len:139 (+) Transcript_6114:64-480(+)|eukprot:CAMPEP_0170591264 /NCGR_PEP_ID=MMETSP0224-20130122/12311_1 /TAXON_ID=285029 /ORGANISM="Togula jolla, Strain CCCM 725" /LENGTH=138 /DNA_ID=CAMNT_0010915117 /DNA_START=60 /DNA_END=476 /DNA_ORIENTATION=+
MARSTGVLLAAAAVAALFLTQQSAFVPAGSVAAGAVGMASMPSWALGPEMALADAQMLLARVPGGKFAKAKDLTVPSPAEDGFTDSQIAFLIVIAGVLFVLAADFARNLNEGQNPTKFKEGKKGYMTPLIKRVIEQGF